MWVLMSSLYRFLSRCWITSRCSSLMPEITSSCVWVSRRIGEGRVLVGDLGQADRDLRLVLAGLGLDGAGDHRGRELDRVRARGGATWPLAGGGHGVGDVQVVELGDGHDVAGDRLLDLLLRLALEPVEVARPCSVLPVRRFTSVVSCAIRPERMRRKLSLPMNRSLVVLKTWATSSPSSSGSSSTSSSSSSARPKRWTSAGLRLQSARGRAAP